MPLALSPLNSLVTPGGRVSFIASGGTPPYSFSVTTNNSGGSIDPSSGQFLAGPRGLVADTVTVEDAVLDTVDAQVTVTAGLWQRTQRNLVPPRFKFPNSQTIEGVYAAEKDTEGERARQGVLVNLPGLAPSDALPIIGAERVLRRASSDTDSSFGEYLRTAWDTQYRCGSHRRVLEELDRAGFPMGTPTGAHVMQRYLRYSWLASSGGAWTQGTHPDPWTFDGAPANNNEQWGIVFGADVIGLSAGTPLANTLNDIVDVFGPRKAKFMGTWIIVSGPTWGFPVGVTWGMGGRNWGGGVTRFVAPM